MGFSRAIDVVGGVDISLTQAEIDYMLQTFPDAELRVGTNHLDGDIALLYARIRKTDVEVVRSAYTSQETVDIGSFSWIRA